MHTLKEIRSLLLPDYRVFGLSNVLELSWCATAEGDVMSVDITKLEELEIIMILGPHGHFQHRESIQ